MLQKKIHLTKETFWPAPEAVFYGLTISDSFVRKKSSATNKKELTIKTIRDKSAIQN